MKRLIALLLALLLAALPLAGCSSEEKAADSSAPAPSSEADASAAPTDSEPPASEPASSEPEPASTEAPTESAPEPTVPDDAVTVGDLTFTSDAAALADNGELRYVLIYNPDYTNDETSWSDRLRTWKPDTRNTGNVSIQIDVDMDRADPLEYESELQWVSQAEFEPIDISGLPFDSDKAGGLPQLYSVGDTHQFYTFNDAMTARSLETYTCLYEGEHCYIWVNEHASLSAERAKVLADRFDSEAWEADNRLYGPGRFTEDGGKVNFMFCNMSGGKLGYFASNDIYSVLDGFTQADIAKYCLNTDHAIVFINAKAGSYTKYEDTVVATMAHEYQHQICASAWIDSIYSGSSVSQPDTWFNEALSGYVEEAILPGIQAEDGRYESLHGSQTLRTGQSLYNFDTSQGIGVYGSVFLFSEYLANLAGEGVFHRFYDYWRYSGSPTLCTAEALYYAVSDEVRAGISEKYAYELNDPKATEYEVWMSKLILDYYVTQFHYDESDPEAFRLIEAKSLLFNSLYPSSLDLESGGRTIFAVSDGFTVPADAREGMIYIGLDKDFLPVGVVVVR